MKSPDEILTGLKEPKNYFTGVGDSMVPNPAHILIFLRMIKEKLQQQAPQNLSHHRFVLIFNLETKGQVHVDHLSLPFGPRQALLIHPYQFHHFSHLASNELQWLFCTFELQNGTLLEPLRNRVLDISPPCVRAREALLEDWARCTDPVWHSELQNAQLQTALARLLLCLCQEQQASATDLPPKSTDSLIRTVNRLLTEWRGRPITTTDLAKALNLSTSRLRTVFRETAGIPLGSYIQNYRLNRAMALLRTTKLPIADVAEEAGFGSPQAFSRLFKKETGDTPRKYRQQE